MSTSQNQQIFRSAKVENALNEVRMDIVFGNYPIGSDIKSAVEIAREYGIGMSQGYRIHEILRQEGFLSCGIRNGSYVIPYDKDYWEKKLSKEIVEQLSVNIQRCKLANISMDQIELAIRNIYHIAENDGEEAY